MSELEGLRKKNDELLKKIQQQMDDIQDMINEFIKLPEDYEDKNY